MGNPSHAEFGSRIDDVQVEQYGFNGKFSNSFNGTYIVKIKDINYGVTITAAEEEGRTYKVFYPARTEESAMNIVIEFAKWEQRERFNKWMRTYLDKLLNSSGQSTQNGWMRVECPGRKFSRIAIPTGRLEYGEGALDTGYTLTITLMAADDPSKAADASRYQGPSNKVVSSTFYPTGQQLSGTDYTGVDILFATPAATPLNSPSTVTDPSDPAYNPSAPETPQVPNLGWLLTMPEQ